MPIGISVTYPNPALKAEVEAAVAKNHPNNETVKVQVDGKEVEQPKYTDEQWVEEVVIRMLEHDLGEVRFKSREASEKAVYAQAKSDLRS